MLLTRWICVLSLCLVAITSNSGATTINDHYSNTPPNINQEAILDTSAETHATDPYSTATEWQASKPLFSFSQHGNNGNRFLELRQASASQRLLIPVPHRVAVEQATAHIEFTNSVALQRGRSHLRILWNGGVIAQVTLDPEYTSGQITVGIPVQYIKGGDNNLDIEVAQHYQAECEDPGNPELWTNIDLTSSTLTMRGHLKAIPKPLTELNRWFSLSGWDAQHISLAALGSSDHHLHAGTVIAQGLATKTETPLIIDAIPTLHDLYSLPKGQDAVIFGTYKEAAAIPGLLTEPPHALGHLAWFSRPDDPGYFVLLVLAEQSENVAAVADALAWSTLPLQATSAMDITEITPALSSPYAAHYATMPGKSYRLTDLGYTTTTLKGLHDHTSIRMWLPPDLFAKNHTLIDLVLHFSYGAALRPDSVMNIYHNNIFLQSVPLNDPQGLQIRDYHIQIPMTAFRPGINEFVFESRMHANTGSNCTTGNTDNLLMTVYDDSTISVPDAPHFVAMPDIRYTLATGFPYLGSLGGQQAIVIEKINADLLSSAWTIAAKIGQLKGDPVSSLTVSTKADGFSNVIRLAAISSVDEAVWKKAPIDLSKAGMINHPTLRNPVTLGEENKSFLKQLYQLIWWNEQDNAIDIPMFYQSSVRHTAQVLENSGIMMQMENPQSKNGTLTLLLADSAAQLRRATGDLVTLWPILSEVEGDLFFWGKTGSDRHLEYNALRMGVAQYHIGTITLLQRIQYFAVNNPLYLLMMVIFVVFLVSWVTRLLLVAYRRRHHADTVA